MVNNKIIEKYNVPVPRYTSYPPANFFSGEFGSQEYVKAVIDSNSESYSNKGVAKQGNISFYIHVPFCFSMCYYCGCNSVPIATRVDVKYYVEALKKELHMVIALLDKNRKVSQIHYGGGTPTILHHSELAQINNIILSSFATIDNPEIAVECHPGYLNEEYWHAIANMGFTRVSLGVQDFNNEVLKVVNRSPSKIPVEKIFEILRAKNIAISLDFIYGLPLQLTHNFLQSIKKAVSLAPNRIVTFSYAHVPWVNKNMLKLERFGLPDSNTKKEIFEQAKGYLLANGYKQIGMDHFVLESDELYKAYESGVLHRNFQGYCTRRTTGEVFGVGVSAIGQLNNCYCQNTKDIEQFIAKINRGEFVIEKGYTLSLQERVVRELIEALMCNYRVEWSKLASILNMSVEQVQHIVGYNDSTLKEVVEDGIVEIIKGSVDLEGSGEITAIGFKITPQGQMFVRNVAALFDAHFIPGAGYSKPL